LSGGKPSSKLYSWTSALVFGGEALPEGYGLETASLLLREAWAVIEVVDDEGVLYNRIAQLFPLRAIRLAHEADRRVFAAHGR